MWKPAAPPSPPKDAEQLLLELANYYQELVEYHQQAAKEAYVRLTQVEALIGEPETVTVKSIELESERSKQKSTPKVSSSEIMQSEDNRDWLNWEVIEAENPISVVKQLLEQNKGKILHIDYIERELTQQAKTIPSPDWEKILVEGEKEELWASVPDAPGCWTISSADIPDLAVKSKKTLRKTGKKAKIIPQTGKMRQYQSLTNAVAACLQQSYPKVCTNQNVVEWLYPGGLSSTRLRKVKEAIGKVLSKGEGDLWQRVAIGKYIWKENV